jgi:hypothetical protein
MLAPLSSLCGINARSFQMKRLSSIAFTTALLLSMLASVALAQNPTQGNDAPAAAAPAQPAPAAAPSPAAPAPAASPAPAATPAPAESPSASVPPASDTPEKKTASTRKKKGGGARMTREQELNHSIDSGTVPSRYRSQVPKEYQQYIPFDKR